jgi:Subtilase family
VTIVSVTGCVGSSLEQTPLPIDQSSTTAQGPVSQASPVDEPSDASTDEGAPVAETGKPSAAPTQTSKTKAAGVRPACAHPAVTGRRECDALVQPDAAPPRVAGAGGCNRTLPYCALDLQTAYGLVQLARNGGRGSIVGIVDAYGYPNAASDLGIYRKTMGLPVCGATCLKIVNQRGRASQLPKPSVDPTDDWQLEEALDLDMVSVVCPNCKIVLVQANSNKNADLAAAVNAAVALGAVAISNSYSGREEGARDTAYQHAGRAITASAGNGSGPRAPCSYAGVVCVGGTSLATVPSGRGWTERPWHNAGSGCSAYVAKPAWQHAKNCKTRAEVDVSAVADPATGVAVYESAAGGWQQMGGTSVGAAIVAGLFALGPSGGRTNAPQWIWRHGNSPVYHHVGSGRSGYDALTGWGTPNGAGGF